MTADHLATAVGTGAAHELDSARQRIRHCVHQLTDPQIWWRARPDLNSIGNLVLHLSGNVRQWIIAGLGGASDVRDRPAEFAERGPIPKTELLRRLDDAVDEAALILAKISPEELLTTRRIQGSDVTGAAAIFHCVPHFRGHTQEIIYLTRLQLGDDYQFAGITATAHQPTSA